MEMTPIASLRERERVLSALAAALDERARATRRVLEAQDTRAGDAARRLVEHIDAALATASDADRASDLLGLGDVSAAALARAVDDERERLTARLAGLPVLVDDVALLDHRHADLLAHAAALRGSVERVARDADFQELKRGRHGASDGAWWLFSTMRQRHRAASVVARHGPALGALDWPTLIARHEDEVRALAVLDEELAALTKQRLAHRRAMSERAELERAREDVVGHVRRRARARIEDALAAKREDELRALADALPFGRALMAAMGARAQRRFIEASLAHHVERTARVVAARLVDTRDALRHAASPIDPHVTERETARLGDEVSRAMRVHEETVERIRTFADWDRAIAETDTHLFELMTGGHVDGSYLDELVWHRTTRAARPPPRARVATWTENAAGAAERLAAIWDSVRDASPAEGADGEEAPPAIEDGDGAPVVPAPVVFDDDVGEDR